MSVLEGVSFPTSWSRVRFGAVAQRVSEVGFGALTPLSVFLGEGVVPRSSRVDNHNQLGADLEKYQRVLPGDLVFNKLRTWQGGFGVSAHTGIVSPAYIVARPSSAIIPRYLHHLMRSDPALAELARLSKWMPPSQFDIAWEDIRGIQLALPPVEEQRRIADFLDDQVRRIDQAIQLRGRQLSALSFARSSFAHSLIRDLLGGGAPLSTVAGIFDTEHKTAPDADEGGWFIAGTNAIRNGRVVRGQLREIDHWAFVEWTRRAEPAVGDVLLTREAPIGQVALLEDGEVLPAIGQRVVLVRPGSRLDSEFLRLILMSPILGDLVSAAAAGSLHPHLNMGDIARLRLPVVDLEVQKQLGARFSSRLAEIESLEGAISSAVDALHELKRSLITAAVTGELDVTTSRRGIEA